MTGKKKAPQREPGGHQGSHSNDAPTVSALCGWLDLAVKIGRLEARCTALEGGR